MVHTQKNIYIYIKKKKKEQSLLPKEEAEEARSVSYKQSGLGPDPGEPLTSQDPVGQAKASRGCHIEQCLQMFPPKCSWWWGSAHVHLWGLENNPEQSVTYETFLWSLTSA